MSLLTIIIPHYNSPITLRKLLLTIPKNENIQVIVVDDNSDRHPNTFLSSEILEQILLLDNESGKVGAGACRNIGLNYANGDWVLFADADDYFVEGFYEIVEEYFDADRDVVFFKAASVVLGTDQESVRHWKINYVVDNYLDIGDKAAELYIRYKHAVPWCKMIRRDFIQKNNIVFDEVIASNDVMFSTRVGYHMQDFFASDETIYVVTESPGSLTRSRNEADYDSRLSVFINRYHYLEERLTQYEFDCLRLHGWYMIHHAISYKFGITKYFSIFRILRANRIKLWDINVLWQLLDIKALTRYFQSRKRTVK